MPRFNDINIPIEDRELTEGQFVTPPRIDRTSEAPNLSRGNIRTPDAPIGERPTFRQINKPTTQPQRQVPQVSGIDPDQPLSKLDELDSTEQYVNERYDRLNSEFQEKLDRKKKLITQGARMGVDFSIVSERLKKEGLDKLKAPKELKELEDFRQEILKDKESEGREEASSKRKLAFKETHTTPIEKQDMINKFRNQVKEELGFDKSGLKTLTEDEKLAVEKGVTQEIGRSGDKALRDFYFSGERNRLSQGGLDTTGNVPISNFSEPVTDDKGNLVKQDLDTGKWFLAN